MDDDGRSLSRIVFLVVALVPTALTGVADNLSADVPTAVATNVKGTVGQRQVYLDMGANWANTLRLWYDIVLKIGAPKRRGNAWEIYAFEASPLIQPYVDEFVKWLNGQGLKPLLTIPPSGSTNHLYEYALRYDCNPDLLSNEFADVRSLCANYSRRFTRKSQKRKRRECRMKQCIFERFKQPLAALKPNPGLNSTRIVQRRLAEAQNPALSGQRYTFVPAAVSAVDGMLNLGHVDARNMIGGGATGFGNEALSGTQMSVIMVDVVSWMISHFTKDDYIIAKMDIEGAEHGIITSLIKQGQFELIDVLLLECHPFAGNCAKLLSLAEREARRTRAVVMTEGHGYEGIDSQSRTSKYFPVDPSKS